MPVGCSTARNKGTCDNRRSVQRERLEARVLNALRYHLMDPALFKEFCDEFTREMNRLRMEGSASIEAARSEIKRIERELDTLLNMVTLLNMIFSIKAPCHNRHEWYMNGYLKIGHPNVRHPALWSRPARRFTRRAAFMLFPVRLRGLP
jgi:hypothetical protein